MSIPTNKTTNKTICVNSCGQNGENNLCQLSRDGPAGQKKKRPFERLGFYWISNHGSWQLSNPFIVAGKLPPRMNQKSIREPNATIWDAEH